MDSASCLAGFIARKPTLSNLSLGEMAFDSRKPTELDVPVVAAAVLTGGGDIAADRKAHTGGWVGVGSVGVDAEFVPRGNSNPINCVKNGMCSCFDVGKVRSTVAFGVL